MFLHGKEKVFLTWDILNVIGTIAFALSGVFVAMEEDYDLMGIYILGFVTAFGGGAIRNILIGVPVTALWEQGTLFFIAFLIMTFAFLLPAFLFETWQKWGLLFDAIGLGAFAVQGAIFAQEMNLPLSASIAAAALTGTGGGMIRDLLAGRKPLFLKHEIYIAWTMLAGIGVGMGWIQSMPGYLTLLAAIILCRMLSVQFNWRLPRSKWHERRT